MWSRSMPAAPTTAGTVKSKPVARAARRSERRIGRTSRGGGCSVSRVWDSQPKPGYRTPLRFHSQKPLKPPPPLLPPPYVRLTKIRGLAIDWPSWEGAETQNKAAPLVGSSEFFQRSPLMVVLPFDQWNVAIVNLLSET